MSNIDQEAADWFVRNRAKAMPAEERAAFIVWLRSSPLHVEEYLKTAVTSRDLHQAARSMDCDIEALLAEARAEDSPNIVPLWSRHQPEDVRPGNFTNRPSAWSRFRPVAAIAASILVIIGAVFWMERDGQRFGLPKEFVTVHGEQGSWLLPDGTSMSLNSDSAATVRYNKRERVVEVERGQALFQVAHETARRFRVAAGETGVIAIGTQFDVFRKSDATLITVMEGRVAVFTGAAPMPTGSATLPTEATAVGAGEQIQVSDRARPVRPSAVNVQQAVAWVQRQVVFDERPLGEVATEFNRYGAIPIVIQSERLRDLPISGVFNAYDTDSFVAFVARLEGVRIERTPKQIRIDATPQ